MPSAGELFFPAGRTVRSSTSTAAVSAPHFRTVCCRVARADCLPPTQLAQLSDQPGRCVYIVFDQDENQAGQKASRQLALRLKTAGVRVRIVHLPHGHDPNSYFVAGASAADFTTRLREADRL